MPTPNHVIKQYNLPLYPLIHKTSFYQCHQQSPGFKINGLSLSSLLHSVSVFEFGLSYHIFYEPSSFLLGILTILYHVWFVILLSINEESINSLLGTLWLYLLQHLFSKGCNFSRLSILSLYFLSHTF